MPSLRSSVNEDWTPENLNALRRALRKAYDAASAFCDPAQTEFFASRNAVFGLGYNRWIAVGFYLEQACNNGELEGITAHWVSMGGTVGTPMCQLELRGAHTCVHAAHLRSPDANPRDTEYRQEKRAGNEKNPLLAGWVEPVEHESETTGLVNLLLVHGDKKAEFAELRAYDDVDVKSSYVQLSENIMVGEVLTMAATESEHVPEPVVALRLTAETQANISTGA